MRRRRLLKAAMKANSEALRLGVYFSWSIAVITAVLMLGETVLLALMTRDTVAVETPASFAMSFTGDGNAAYGNVTDFNAHSSESQGGFAPIITTRQRLFGTPAAFLALTAFAVSSVFTACLHCFTIE
jgi:hypothetical protein